VAKLPKWGEIFSECPLFSISGGIILIFGAIGIEKWQKHLLALAKKKV